LKVLIVDDEFPARALLRHFLEDMKEISYISECTSGEDALEYVKQNQNPDIVFMDIKMNRKDGLTTASEILRLDSKIHLVFTTGYSDYAVEAFELNALDYIVKPYSKERVRKTVDRLINMPSNTFNDELMKELFNNCKKLPVWQNDRLIVLNYIDIIFIKSYQRGKCLVYTLESSFVTNHTLKEIEIRLERHQFMRTHKSFIVNSEKVRQIIPWFNNTYNVILEGTDQEIPVSRHYINVFKKTMGIED
jgi:DNA-binding LytR/AlgR family response regulator